MKILLAKLGLDVHNRGILLVSNVLRDSGMEVIYIGNAMPKEIIAIAVKEGVDMIGVSSLAGSHLTLGRALIDEIETQDIYNMLTSIGGVFPPDDAKKLKALGFDCVFTSGDSCDYIVNTLKRAEAENARRCA